MGGGLDRALAGVPVTVRSESGEGGVGSGEWVWGKDGTVMSQQHDQELETERLTAKAVSHSDLIANVGPQGHELPGFSLATNDFSASVTFNRLLLHTWDTSYVSGETSWNGTEYGCMFRAGGLS